MTDTSHTQTVMTISELTRAFDITARTARFYESEGLIAPERRGTHRLFHHRDQVRLKLILRGRRLGFSVAEIKDIIGLYDQPPGEAGQLSYLLEKIEERRQELVQKRRDIDAILNELDDLEGTCRAHLSGVRRHQSEAAE